MAIIMIATMYNNIYIALTKYIMYEVYTMNELGRERIETKRYEYANWEWKSELFVNETNGNEKKERKKE